MSDSLNKIMNNSLLSNESELKSEFNRRTKRFDYTSVSKKTVEEYKNNGWSFDRKLKVKIKLRREKKIDELLENRFWCLMYRMGYKELNKGRNYKIIIKRRGIETDKQIDVFAKDDETVIIAECKASNSLSKKSLSKDLEEFSSLKGPIARSINKYYEGKKLKILWFFITYNIIWSKPDVNRAKASNIHFITEKELRYYNQIAVHLGHAARYQFLAEYLKKQSIPGLNGIKIPAIKGKLAGKNFYCFLIAPENLLKISFINHRSLNDPEGAPTYQRLVTNTRIKQINRFLLNGGYFPTNILINFVSKVAFEKGSSNDLGSSDFAFGSIILPDKYQSAWIIDGQHRLYGYANLPQKIKESNLIVVAFEKLSKDEEANLFVTINHEQKSVPKNLLDDLEGELKWGSKVISERIGSIAARLINVLNNDTDEPLFNRVTQQGIKATERTCLTMPALKDGIKKSGIIGRHVVKGKRYDLGPFCGESDLKTLDRARHGMNYYLSLFRNRCPQQWEEGRNGIICTNVAIQAKLLLLGKLIKFMENRKHIDAMQLQPHEIIEEIQEYIEPILDLYANSSTNDLQSRFKVKYGSGGPMEYFFRLVSIINRKYSDFSPDGFLNWSIEQSQEKIEKADSQLKDLNIIVHSIIFDTLKEKYGTENEAYWHKGISDKNIRAEAYKKSLDAKDDERLSPDNYLDFIQYKKIVEHKINWQFFEPMFNIPELNEKGFSKNLKWMDKINELRRIPAHATKERKYKVEDFEYIDFIYNEVFSRINSDEYSDALKK